MTSPSLQLTQPHTVWAWKRGRVAGKDRRHLVAVEGVEAHGHDHWVHGGGVPYGSPAPVDARHRLRQLPVEARAVQVGRRDAQLLRLTPTAQKPAGPMAACPEIPLPPCAERSLHWVTSQLSDFRSHVPGVCKAGTGHARHRTNGPTQWSEARHLFSQQIITSGVCRGSDLQECGKMCSNTIAKRE